MGAFKKWIENVAPISDKEVKRYDNKSRIENENNNLLEKMLLEMQKMNMYLSIMTDTDIKNEDL